MATDARAKCARSLHCARDWSTSFEGKSDQLCCHECPPFETERAGVQSPEAIDDRQQSIEVPGPPVRSSQQI
jgi:hypothetical protein